MYATLSFRLSSGRRSFITTDQFTLSARCAVVTRTTQPKTPANIFRMPSPPFQRPSLATPKQRVENEPENADDEHAGDNEVIALAGVASVDDEIAETGVDGDHLRGDEHHPGDAERHAQPDGDARQHCGRHEANHQLRRAQSKVLA